MNSSTVAPLQQHDESLQRLKAISEKEDERRAVLPAGKQSLDEAMLAYEAEIISRALVCEGGMITKAATLLGITYQGLRCILEGRQKGIKHLAGAKRKRNKSIMKEKS